VNRVWTGLTFCFIFYFQFFLHVAWVVLFQCGFGPCFFRGLLFPHILPDVFSCNEDLL